jgi:hypothetical protein
VEGTKNFFAKLDTIVLDNLSAPTSILPHGGGSLLRMSPPNGGRLRGGMDKVKSVFVGLKPNLFTIYSLPI